MCVCVCVYYNGNITISFLHYNTVILHSSDTVFFSPSDLPHHTRLWGPLF